MNDENDDQYPLIRSADVEPDAIFPDKNLRYIIQMKHAENLRAFTRAKHDLLAEEADLRAFEAHWTIKISSLKVSIKPKATRKPGRIYRPPGYAMAGPLRFLLPKKVFERVVEQMILDAREEHAEALAAGHLKHARWIAFRLYIMVGFALFTKAATLPFEKFTQFMQKD